jgi:hypothetical protein
MRPECLPLATPYDPAEDPPGSIDPLGTVAGAEQLADVLFSGMTARMWRARHLTFTALAAFVSEQAAAGTGGNEELRLEARLALERLFVSAVARQERRDDEWRRASRRLPGIGLARRALVSGDQPLGKQTFLKGQAINGPFGVVARLARHVDIIDDDNHLSRNGQELLLAWSAEQELPGLLDECNSKSPGATWIRRLTGSVVDYAQDARWPPSGWWGWSDLADRLRPDAIDSQERKVIYRLLIGDRAGVRRRCLELLERKETVADYARLIGASSRGELDRQVLVSDLGSMLDTGGEGVDRLIEYTIGLIEAYEQVGGHLETVVRGLLWALTHRGGRATEGDLLADPTLVSHLDQAKTHLQNASTRLADQLNEISHFPELHRAVDEDRLKQLLCDAQSALTGRKQLVEQVLERHQRVQQQKRKGVWIERDRPYLTLIPGFGDTREAPWSHDGTYLHPFRVTNAYSLLGDLGRIRKVEVPNAEEE